MAALSENLNRTVRTRIKQAFKIANTIQAFGGSFAALRTAEHATAASRGYAAPYNDAAGNLFLGGHFNRKILGDTSATPVPESDTTIEGEILKRVDVTGVSAITDVGKSVYATTDNDLTLTRGAINCPVGFIVRWHTGTSVDVLLFSAAEMAILTLSGCAGETILLGSIDAGIADGAAISSWPAHFHGKITGTFAIQETINAGASPNIAADFTVGGSAMTGGIITIAGAGTAGAKVAGAAVTANNIFHEGDVITVSQTDNGTTDSGRYLVYIEVEKQIGL